MILINPYRFGNNAYYNAVIADGPIWYARMDDPSGTSCVDVISANNGTYVGSPTLGATGRIAGNSAVEFDGTTQNVTIPDSVWPTGAAARSFELWCFPNTTQNSASHFILFGHGGTGLLTYFVATIDLTGTNELYFYSNGRDYYTANNQITRNAWNHVVVTYNGGAIQTAGNLKMYINGADKSLTGSGASTGNLNTSNTAAAITNAASAGLTGRIDEVAVYDYVLTSTQVSDHYNAA